MSYNYDRTASMPDLAGLITKLNELGELLEEMPEIEEKGLHPSFTAMVRSIKRDAEKVRFQAANKVVDYKHKLRDLKRLLEESAEAQK